MSFFRKKQGQSTDADQTALGLILTKMGVCNAEQVQYALKEQAKASEDKRIGIFLVAAGIIPMETLEAALLYQENLRSKSRHKQAIAESQIAQQQAGGVIDFALAVRESMTGKVAEIKRRTSNHGHPAITEAMLAKASKD